MARPTLFNHPKLQRLVFVLGVSKAQVIGHLELLWNVGYASGEPVIGDAIDVELGAEWAGERGAFVHALADPSIRLIDAVGDGRYAIHDLHDHAPRYVQDRWRKEQQRKKNGAHRKRRTSGGQAADKRRTNGGHDAAIVTSGRHVSATPSPTPSPTPAPSPTPTREQIKSVSSVPAVAVTEPAILTFPTVGSQGTEWPLTVEQMGVWVDLHPGVDVLAECRKALAWCLANPTRRKTAVGMPKFLAAWLGKAQDNSRGTVAPFKASDKGSRTLAAGQEAIELLGRMK